MTKMSEEVYIDDAARTSPIGGSMPSGRIGGLIVRRECSDTKGSARFARSLTAGMNHIARVLSIRDMRWRD